MRILNISSTVIRVAGPPLRTADRVLLLQRLAAAGGSQLHPVSGMRFGMHGQQGHRLMYPTYWVSPRAQTCSIVGADTVVNWQSRSFAICKILRTTILRRKTSLRTWATQRGKLALLAWQTLSLPAPARAGSTCSCIPAMFKCGVRSWLSAQSPSALGRYQRAI